MKVNKSPMQLEQITNPGQVGPESSRPGSTRPRPVWGPRYGGRIVRLEGGCICMFICLSVNLMD